jgi:hypothetical protein
MSVITKPHGRIAAGTRLRDGIDLQTVDDKTYR